MQAELDALARQVRRIQRQLDALETVSSGDKYDAVFRSFMAILGANDPDRWLLSSVAAHRAAYHASATRIARELRVRKARVLAAMKTLNMLLNVPESGIEEYLNEVLR